MSQCRHNVHLSVASHVTSVQAHPFRDEAPETATTLQPTRVPDSDLQQPAPSSPALQDHGSSRFAATHPYSPMQQDVQQTASSRHADRSGLASATAAMSRLSEQCVAKHALPSHAEPLMDSMHSQAKERLSQKLMMQPSADWQRVHAELQQLAASSEFCLHSFVQERSPAMQQVAALHGSSSASDIGGLERNAAANHGREVFMRCDVGSTDRAGPSDIQRVGTASETEPASSNYYEVSFDNRAAATHMHAACPLNVNGLVTSKMP